MTKSHGKKSSHRTQRRSSHGSKGSGSGGGGGGILSALRGGFQNAARTATGSRKPQTKTGQTISYAITVALLVLAAYLALRRFGYI